MSGKGHLQRLIKKYEGSEGQGERRLWKSQVSSPDFIFMNGLVLGWKHLLVWKNVLLVPIRDSNSIAALVL